VKFTSPVTNSFMAKRKISYPVYRQPSQVSFGTGSSRILADVDVATDAVFLISSQTSVRETLRGAFSKQGSVFDEWPVLEKPPGEPTRDTVAACAEWLSDRPAYRLIAVGGGSVLDWARLASAVAGGWLDLNTGGVTAPAAAWSRPELVLVPTTCGSGAEAAGVSVYTAGGVKRAVVSQSFIADRVILDGQFLSAFDATAVAPFLCDALSHAIEAFVSIVPNQFAKYAAANALQLILDHQHASDPCSRERLMEAGYLGGVAASNCSVGVVHAFAHALACYGVPHGIANGLGLSAGIATNAMTDEMANLLGRTGFATPEDLQEAVKPLISAAVSSSHAEHVRDLLARPSDRDLVIGSMEADVCLRTNPRRLDRADLHTFCDRVAADLQR
jgi:alcohol dehydrogenase